MNRLGKKELQFVKRKLDNLITILLFVFLSSSDAIFP